MQKFVNVEGVNLRSVPSTEDNSPIGLLTLGEAVEDLGDGPPGWNHVRMQAGLEGFCVAELAFTKASWAPPKQPTLREPVSAAREALVAAAVEQWLRFDKGEGRETEDPYVKFVGEMWKAFGKRLTGKNTDAPWSAVAISLMVRNAARTVPQYAQFPESIGHARYMWEAIRKAASGDLGATFWGVRLDKAKPEVGDIIGSWREKPFTFDQFLAATTNPEIPCHCDVVVAVGPQLCLAIGGNVKQSVYATGYQLFDSGFLAPNQRIRKVAGKPDKLVGEAIVLMGNRVS